MLFRSRAESFAGAAVAIPESELPTLPDGEFYWRELIGCAARLPEILSAAAARA